ATAWARRAELDNCVSNGSGSACLVPFSDEALHVMTEGMTNAADVLVDFLTEDDPNKLSAVWMLNVAHMALGDYPDAVDERWRVPPERLLPEREVEAWPNAMPSIGFTTPTIAGSAALDDFDGDGLLDILNSAMEPEVGMTLWLARGDGTFCDASEPSGVSSITGLLGFSTADYDNDGDLDVLAPRGAWMLKQGLIRLSLLRNDGQGHFVDVAEEAGLTQVFGPSQVSVWADFNMDGWLDLFVGRERVDPQVGPGDAPSSLFFNQRDGTFEDVADSVGLRWLGFVKGAAAGDYDNDGDPDLFVSVLGGENRLFRNDTDAHMFVDAGRRQEIQAPIESFAATFLDYDQDGALDLFCSAYPNTYAQEGVLADNYGRSEEGFIADLLGLPTDGEFARLYHNTDGLLADVTVATGLDDVHATMGLNFGDFDVDGWPDLYLATGAPAYDALEPNVAYVNDRGQRFLDVTSSMHTGHLQKGHGVAFGDLDEDGDEDLLANIGGAFPGDAFPEAMFLNPTADHHSLTLRLEGVTANRYAVGARVRVVTPSRTFHHVVGTGGSFGNNSHQVEAGLGAETEITSIEIDWPAGPREVWPGVAVDQVVKIREGEGIVEQRPYAPRPIDLDHDHDP
ncbi:MAG TPA: CRTAC1 family protein, partial [Myxococcota bacterium]|nr:CRTAC1 family protein [Myxococcota bacterium]